MKWQSFRGDAPADMTIYSASFPDISDQWPMKDDVTREINALNQAMKANPELLPPLLEEGENGLPRLIPQHLHSDQAYRTRPAMAAWRARLVPSAAGALRAGAVCGAKSAGRAPARRYADGQRKPPVVYPRQRCHRRAIPVLEALRTAKLDGQKVHLSLVDDDPVALRWAETMAAQEGLNVGEQLTLLKRHLVHTLIRSDDLVLELGEHQAELVDALGIFEYFNDVDAVIFLQRALRLVKPGGAVIVSNMLTTSPQIDFILRCIGWAHIFPRSLQQLQDIHLAAGIPVENVTVIVPKDGVYAVMEIRV